MKQAIKVTFVLVILHSLLQIQATAQDNQDDPDKLDVKADQLSGGKKDGASFRKLIGNVMFTQKNTVIYCDSATLFPETNSMEAFGHVKIEDLEDSVTITSNKLFYDGNGRLAELRENVVYIDDSIQLYTENLDYDMINKSAIYFNGGRVEDGTNTLESQKGNYDTAGKMMIFNDSVKMTTPDYVMKSNDLIFNMITKKARTNSYTRINTPNGESIEANKMEEFDTTEGTSAFFLGEINTDKYYLKGNELFLDNQSGSYVAKGNVYLLAKKDSVIITGENANFWQDLGIAKVYGDPLLKKMLRNDTLFLRADTLVSIDDSLEVNKRLLAYNNVKIFKTDLQAKADSLAYYLADSSISFYNDPILWNDGSQITADTIDVLMDAGTIDQLRTSVNSFIISEDSTKNFNQIKGRQLIAHFEGKSIKKVDVNGNGESIYFVAEEENTAATMGVNKIICSNMKITFKENQVNDIWFYVNPDGRFVPPHELKDEDEKLEGFAWRIEERPTKKEILINPLEYERIAEEEGFISPPDPENKTKIEELVEKNLENNEKIKKQLQQSTESPKKQ